MVNLAHESMQPKMCFAIMTMLYWDYLGTAYKHAQILHGLNAFSLIFPIAIDSFIVDTRSPPGTLSNTCISSLTLVPF